VDPFDLKKHPFMLLVQYEKAIKIIYLPHWARHKLAAKVAKSSINYPRPWCTAIPLYFQE